MRQKLRKIIVGIAPLLLLLACSEVEERPLQTGSITISDMQFDTTADSAGFSRFKWYALGSVELYWSQSGAELLGNLVRPLY